ncbi:hypothetical protein PR048_014099 [Dryococelus australis]|uniref:C2H2-type domain-containing protein n=1 Tax=Dryococelus australis TaxID=614101 RepID=A0ABQ9HD97_9NEOP|nr:hypothetical protein PR048_014099 [Dryococelus australis]
MGVGNLPGKVSSKFAGSRGGELPIAMEKKTLFWDKGAWSRFWTGSGGWRGRAGCMSFLMKSIDMDIRTTEHHRVRHSGRDQFDDGGKAKASLHHLKAYVPGVVLIEGMIRAILTHATSAPLSLCARQCSASAVTLRCVNYTWNSGSLFYVIKVHRCDNGPSRGAFNYSEALLKFYFEDIPPPNVHAALQEHCTPVQEPARRGVGALVARASVDLISSALLRRTRRMQEAGSHVYGRIVLGKRADIVEGCGGRDRSPLECIAQLAASQVIPNALLGIADLCLPRTIGDQLRMSTILAASTSPAMAVGHQGIANDRISRKTAARGIKYAPCPLISIVGYIGQPACHPVLLTCLLGATAWPHTHILAPSSRHLDQRPSTRPRAFSLSLVLPLHLPTSLLTIHSRAPATAWPATRCAPTSEHSCNSILTSRQSIPTKYYTTTTSPCQRTYQDTIERKQCLCPDSTSRYRRFYSRSIPVEHACQHTCRQSFVVSPTAHEDEHVAAIAVIFRLQPALKYRTVAITGSTVTGSHTLLALPEPSMHIPTLCNYKQSYSARTFNVCTTPLKLQAVSPSEPLTDALRQFFPAAQPLHYDNCDVVFTHSDKSQTQVSTCSCLLSPVVCYSAQRKNSYKQKMATSCNIKSKEHDPACIDSLPKVQASLVNSSHARLCAECAGSVPVSVLRNQRSALWDAARRKEHIPYEPSETKPANTRSRTLRPTTRATQDSVRLPQPVDRQRERRVGKWKDGVKTYVASTSRSGRIMNSLEADTTMTVLPFRTWCTLPTKKASRHLQPAYKAFHCDNYDTVFTHSDNLYTHNKKCKGNVRRSSGSDSMYFRRTFANRTSGKYNGESNCSFPINYTTYTLDHYNVIHLLRSCTLLQHEDGINGCRIVTCNTANMSNSKGPEVSLEESRYPCYHCCRILSCHMNMESMLEHLPSIKPPASTSPIGPEESQQALNSECHYCGNTFSHMCNTRHHENSPCLFSPAHKVFHCDKCNAVLIRRRTWWLKSGACPGLQLP